MKVAVRSIRDFAVLGVLAVVVLLAGALPATANPSGTGLVLSQVYGGGGNAGATLRNDFIELFNPSSAPIDVTGWSVQYAATTGTNWQRTNLTPTTIQPGQYYLVQEAAGAGGSVNLPTPDATGSIPMAAGAGKVVLISNQTTIAAGTSCPSADVVDLVGYGTGTNCFEGTGPTSPTLTNTTAALRAAGGCTDTDSTAADFANGAPDPRNTGSALNPCTAGVNLSVSDVSHSEGNAGTTAYDFTVSLSSPAGSGGVTFDIATADDSATAPGDYTARSLAGQAIAQGSSTYTFSVSVNGDTTTEPDESFFVNVTNVSGATVTDGQGVGTIVNDDVCGQPYTPISDIQGSGPRAAITGNVATQGVVVGDFDGPTSTGLEGFYIQDLTGDGDAATSDGLFVYTGSATPVTAGQLVRVTGFARERFDQTSLNGSNSNTSPVTNIVACGTGSVAPTDVTMPFPTLDYPERYEGMLTRFPQSLVISEYFNYDRFGELVLARPLAGESRPFTPTAVVAPGAPAQARALANSLSRITLDDGLGSQNPEFLRHPNGSQFLTSNLFRGGDTVTNTVGVLGYDFGVYRIQPTGPATYQSVNPRPTTTPSVGNGTLRVGGQNTLNFFLTLDYPTGDPADNKCGPAQNVECRGADSDQPNEFTRQRTKLLKALAGLNGDIVGLNELENTTGVDPLGDPAKGIVPGLNAMPGVGPYNSIDTGVIGTDAIRVGLIYKPSRVTPVGPFKVLTTAVDPRFIDTKNRPSLAQTFKVNATGAKFTVVVNHLKSKGSDCLDVGDPDTGDGQGNCNITRRNAAQALVDWLATDPTGSGDPDFLVIGDLNSYAMEDPVTAIQAGSDDTAGTADDFRNLIKQFVGTYAYSYTFDGQAGYLDHALANATLAPQVTGAAEWHINSDEPDVVDYDTSFKGPQQEALYEPNTYRCSDHDSVLTGLFLTLDYDDLCALTQKLSSKSEDDLCDLLQEAQLAEQRGDLAGKASKIDQYVKKVTAQSNRSNPNANTFTSDEAALLIRLARAL